MSRLPDSHPLAGCRSAKQRPRDHHAILTGCRVVVLNEVTGTREETLSPQTPEEAIKNHGAVALACEFIYWTNGDDWPAEDDWAIAVCIHRTADQVTVRWYKTNHWCTARKQLGAAREQMQQVLDGTWRESRDQL